MHFGGLVRQLVVRCRGYKVLYFCVHNYRYVIIMAGMAVVLRGRLPHRGEAQMAYNYCFPTRTMF